jgi:hypothetical protein
MLIFFQLKISITLIITDISIMTAKTYTIEDSQEPGYKTVSVLSADGKKTYLHSKIAPSRESSAFSKIFSSFSGDTLVLLGLGLGHHLRDIAKASSVKHIIAVEKIGFTNAEIAQNFTWASKTLSAKITYIIGKDSHVLQSELESHLVIQKDTSVAIIEHPASARAFPEYYAYARDIIQKIIRKKAGNISTVQSFAGIFIRNCIKKISTLAEYYPFKALEKSFINMPCVILSSSPSVDQYISLIAKYQKSFIIIAVDSAAPILKAHSILPDILISTDPQPWTDEHLLCTSDNVPSIVPLSAHFTAHKNQISFVFLNTHPFSQMAEHHYPDIGNADSKTGTVAGDALYAASLMGFSHIFLTGVDFSFPKHCIYSKDSYYNYRYTALFNSRLAPCESLHMKYIRRSPRTVYNNSVVTRSSFLQFNDSIARMIKDKSLTQITLLTDSGLSIEGTKIISAAEDADKILSSFPELQDKQSIIGSLIKNTEKLKNTELSQTMRNPQIFNQILTESSSQEHSAKKGTYYRNLFTKLSGQSK